MNKDIQNDEYPSQEDINAAEAGDLAPNGLGKVFYNFTHSCAVRLGLLGLATYGIYEGYQHNVPAIKEPIDSLGTNLAGRWQELMKHVGPQSIEMRFPTPLPAENFASLSADEMENLWSKTKEIDGGKKVFILGFPASNQTIEHSNIRMSASFETAFAASPDIDTANLEKEGFKNVFQLTGFKKGDEISLNFDPNQFEASILTIYVAGETQGTGPNSYTPAYTGVRVQLRDKITDKNYQFTLSALHAELSIPSSPFPKDHSPIFKDGTFVNPGQPLVRLTSDSQDYDGNGAAFPYERGQIIYSAVITSNFDQNRQTYVRESFDTQFLKTAAGKVAITGNK